MALASALAAYEVRACGPRPTIAQARCAIGATGAVGTTTGQVGFTRASAGNYTLVYPASKYAHILVSIISPLGTVRDAYVSAQDAPAGTATIICGNAAGTATDPASGDILMLTIIGEGL